MSEELEKQMEEYLRPLFGDMAPITIETQKEKLGLGDAVSKNDYLKVAEEIKKLCGDMAGEIIAKKIYDGLISMIEKEENQG